MSFDKFDAGFWVGILIAAFASEAIENKFSLVIFIPFGVLVLLVVRYLSDRYL